MAWRGVYETRVGACVLEIIAGHLGAPHVLNQCDHTILEGYDLLSQVFTVVEPRLVCEYVPELENPRLSGSKTPD